MAGWLRRLVGAPGAPKPSATPAAVPTRTSGTASTDLAPAAPGFSARRPLISTQGALAGFEFRLVEAVEHRVRSRPDAVVRAAHVIALQAAMRPTVESGQVAMTSIAHDLLARPAVLDALQSGTHIVVEFPEPAEPRQWPDLRELRRRGIRIGSQAASPEATGPEDFVVLPHDVDALASRVAAWRTARPGVPVVVTEISDTEELERVLALDIAFASADLRRMPTAPRRRAPQPDVTRIAQVLAQLRDDRHAAEVSKQLGSDVTLSYRLLRYVNSAAMGLSRSVASIDEAVLLLGHAGLYRWLSIALLVSADGSRASRALQEVSLARARFMETLAREQGEEEPQALFTVGLLSLLDALLQAPLAEALAPLHLGEFAMQSLLEGRGPWHAYLALAQDIEANRLTLARERAENLGGLESALRRSDEAWQWAANVAQAMGR